MDVNLITGRFFSSQFNYNGDIKAKITDLNNLQFCLLFEQERNIKQKI